MAALNEDVPVCRCDFVHHWIEAHKKYFPQSSRLPKLITRVSTYTFGQSPILYHYSEPMAYPVKDVRLPYIVPAPHRISPMRPIYH